VALVLSDVAGAAESPVLVPKVYGGTQDEPIVVGSRDEGQAGQKEDSMFSFSILTSAQQASQSI